MLQLSFDKLDSPLQASLVSPEVFYPYVGVIWTLNSLVQTELEILKDELCSMAAGPDLPLQYAIVQQRYLCLQDLAQFFKVLEEKLPATE